MTENCVHYSRLFDLSTDLMCIANTQGYIIKANKAWEVTLGYTLDYLYSIPFIELVHPEDQEDTLRAANDLSIGKPICNFENRYKHANGHYRWLNWNSSSLTDEGLIYAVVRDITEVKRTLTLSAEAEHISKVGWWEIDVHSNELYWSTVTHEIHGTKAQTYKPQLEDGLRYFPESAQPAIQEAVQKLMQDGTQYDLQLPFVDVNNIHKWVRATGTITKESGKITRLFGTIQDITQQRLQILSLQSKTELLDQAQDIALLGGWELDVASGITKWTKQVYAIHEVPLDYDHNRYNGLDFYTPEYRDVIGAAVQSCIENGTPFNEIAKFITAKQNFKWVRATGRAYYENGKVQKVIGIFQDITAVKTIQDNLEYEKEIRSALIQNLGDGFVLFTPEGVQQECNTAFCAMTQFTQQELLGSKIPNIPYWPAFLVDEFQKAFTSVATTGSGTFEMQFLRKDGSVFPVLINAATLFEPHTSKPLYHYATIKDITENKQKEQKLLQQNEELTELQTILDQGSLVSITNEQGIITHVNSKFCEVSGYTEQELIGKSHKIVNSKTHSKDFWKEFWTTIKSGNPWEGDVCNRKKDGSLYWIHAFVCPIIRNHTRIGFMAIRQDITKQKELENQLREIAVTDTLTQLKNRKFFMEQLDVAFERFKRYNHSCWVLMCDLDHFKNINDTYGHECGDIVLKSIGQILQNTLRNSDVVARIGGEEFACLIFGKDYSIAQNTTQRILQQIAQSKIEYNNTTIPVTVSIGETRLTANDKTGSEALKRADQALYQAKETGRNRVVSL
jgi:diguanylate cyclase (GGDEF)-like protein/PAS domain S-box-containing protein